MDVGDFAAGSDGKPGDAEAFSVTRRRCAESRCAESRCVLTWRAACPTDVMTNDPVALTRRSITESGFRFDVFNHVANGGNLVVILIGNLDVKFVFERHHEFNNIK